MRRASLGVVPGRVAAIAKFVVTLVPCPEFDQRMHRQIQMAAAPHLPHDVEVLLNGSTIVKRFQNIVDTHLRIGREESAPTMIFLHEQCANHAGGTQTGRHRAPTARKRDTEQQHRQSPTVVGMQSDRQPLAPLRSLFGTFPTTYRIRHPWLSYFTASFAAAA
jgi:hypothetical protein